MTEEIITNLPYLTVTGMSLGIIFGITILAVQSIVDIFKISSK